MCPSSPMINLSSPCVTSECRNALSPLPFVSLPQSPFGTVHQSFPFKIKILCLNAFDGSLIPTPGKQSKLFSLISKALDHLVPTGLHRLTSLYSSRASQVFHEDAFLSLNMLDLLPTMLFPILSAQSNPSFLSDFTYLKPSPVTLQNSFFSAFSQHFVYNLFCIVMVLCSPKSSRIGITFYFSLHSQCLAHRRCSINIYKLD